MNQSKLQTILTLMTYNPVISTDNVTRYFADRGSPSKRASEYLHQLESQKLVEGKRRAIGEPKVWRLSKKGREQQNVNRFPVALTSNKVNHYITIANVYQDLKRMGELKIWRVELREKFGKDVYSPDAFFVLQTAKGTKAFLLEVQESPLTTKRWGEKWAVASRFFESDDFKTASFQVIKDKVIRPNVIVISSQQPETVQGESRFNFILCNDIKKATLF